MRSVALICLAAGAVAAQAAHLRNPKWHTDFDAFTKHFGKRYSKDELALRRVIFEKNVHDIEMHNRKKSTFFMRANEFTDLTGEEFAARYIGGWRGPSKRVGSFATEHLRTNIEDLPASVDWVSKGAVTPVKNQGQCGSCWAFSTTGSVEGISFISTGSLPDLSEQQLVDCSGAYGNQGCNGGLMDNAFQYIIANHGICSESAYPYTGTDGTCQSSSCTAAATISGYTNVPVDNVGAMMSAVAQQPVSVAIEANQLSFQFYGGGVLTASCGTALDHGVLVVGYGSDGGNNYWKVKNSWGASWGMNGYVLLGRSDGSGNTSTYNSGAGQCGLLSVPSYPTK